MVEERNWGYYIKALRESKGMTQGELAAKTGLSRSHISRIETGAYKYSSQDTFQRLATGFGLSPNELTEVTHNRPIPIHQETPEEILNKLKLATPVSIPVYTDFPFHAGDAVEPVDYVYRARPKTISKNIEGYIVYGRCLEPEVSSGNIIIIDRQGEINNGDIVACLVDNELHIARLRKIADELWLENNAGRTRLEDCQVAAPVIEVIRRLK